jgi:AraC-like DNA-binding protein
VPSSSLLERYSFNTRPRRSDGPQGAVHTTFEVNLLAAGRELTLQEGQLTELGRGQCGIIPAQVEHSSWTRAHAATFHNVHLDDAQLTELAGELGIRNLDWAERCFTASHGLEQLFTSLRREHVYGKGAAGHALLQETLALQLGILLIRQANRSAPQRRAPARPHPLARLARAEELLRSDLSSPHTIGALAAAAGMSPFHFVRAFKKTYGRPPHAYLIDLRLEHARELIRTTALPLTAIALEVGFSSSGRFSDAFSRKFGLPPSAWASSGSGRRKIQAAT